MKHKRWTAEEEEWLRRELKANDYGTHRQLAEAFCLAFGAVHPIGGVIARIKENASLARDKEREFEWLRENATHEAEDEIASADRFVAALKSVGETLGELSPAERERLLRAMCIAFDVQT